MSSLINRGFGGDGNMKRIQYHRYGGPEEMRLEDYELPKLKSGQILVRVAAASLNPVDWKIRNGMMKFMTGSAFPRGMGTDFSGVVEEVGSAVTGLRKGDAVFGTVPLKAAGTFAERLVTEARLVGKKPPSLSFEQAACIPVAGVTAWCGLVNKAKVRAGQSVFINGCSGGVGQAAVQIARHLGASVAGSCGTDSVEEARSMGVDPVIDYTRETPAALARKFDILFDTPGTLSIKDGLELLTPRGVMLDINPSLPKFFRGLISPRHKLVFGAQSDKLLQILADLAAAGKLKFLIGKTTSLATAIQLITDQEQGRKVKGKAVIVMDAR